jgi:hypothetical protein
MFELHVRVCLLGVVIARTDSSTRVKPAFVAVLIAALALIAAAVIRYLEMPSFWLDEAFVAVALRNPSPDLISNRLEPDGTVFPRLYLSAIALVRHFTGYQIWSLRLPSLLFFIAATILWARLLIRVSSHRLILGILAGALLLGSVLWLSHGGQLKQYSLDVFVSLLPFAVPDQSLDQTLTQGKRKLTIVALAVPLLISYTYPYALAARLAGWYLYRVRWRGPRAWKLSVPSLALFFAAAFGSIALLWFADLRFTWVERPAYTAYWSSCILGVTLKQGILPSLHVLEKFFWGWHRGLIILIAVVAPLQAIGLWSVFKGLTNSASSPASGTGSVLVGSVFVIGGLILASLLGIYPICADRITLFAQVHFQLLTIEGVSFILARWQTRPAVVAASVVATLLSFYAVRDYGRFVVAEPTENLRPLIRRIDSSISDRLWVHECSVAQVRSLPDRLPVSEVVLGNSSPDRNLKVARGERIWVLWSHLGAEYCVRSLEQVKARAHSWQVVEERSGRGLALAEF